MLLTRASNRCFERQYKTDRVILLLEMRLLTRLPKSWDISYIWATISTGNMNLSYVYLLIWSWFYFLPSISWEWWIQQVNYALCGKSASFVLILEFLCYKVHNHALLTLSRILLTFFLSTHLWSFIHTKGVLRNLLTLSLPYCWPLLLYYIS